MSLNNQRHLFYIWNVAPFTAILHPTLCSLPSSQTVSAHNQGPWWDQLSISGHKRIDLVQHGVAHVLHTCTHTQTRVVMCSMVRLRPGGSFGKSGAVPVHRELCFSYVQVMPCKMGALCGQDRMCVSILSVSIKCCLFLMGSCVVKAAITLLSSGFFRHQTSLSDSKLHHPPFRPPLFTHLMAFLFSSTVALWQWSDILWFACQNGSPFVPVSSLYPSLRGTVGVLFFPSRPLDCCMFYKPVAV